MLAEIKDIRINAKGVTLVFSEVNVDNKTLNELRQRIGDLVDLSISIDPEVSPDV